MVFLIAGAGVLAAGAQATTTNPVGFELRFTSPVRLAGELTGHVRSDARAKYELASSITVGTRVVAKPNANGGTSSARWRVVRVHLTAAQRQAVSHAARVQGRRPRLNVRIFDPGARAHHGSSRYFTFVMTTH